MMLKYSTTLTKTDQVACCNIKIEIFSIKNIDISRNRASKFHPRKEARKGARNIPK